MLLFRCSFYAYGLIGVVLQRSVLLAHCMHTCVCVFSTTAHLCIPSLPVHFTFNVTHSTGSAHISHALSQSVYIAVD